MLKEKFVFDLIGSWYTTALRIGLTMGFLLVSYYFLSIGYFPTNDLSTFISVLLYEALLSFVAFGLLFLVLFLAPYFWIKTILGTARTCYWVVGRESFEMICNIARKEYTRDTITSNAAYIRIFAVYGSFTFSYVSILSYYYWHKSAIALLSLIFAGAICFCISFFIFPSFFEKKDNDCLHQEIESQKKINNVSFWNLKLNFINVMYTVIASIVSGLFLFIGVIFIYFLISPIENIVKFITILLVIAVSGMSLIINEKYNNLKTSMLISTAVSVIAFIPLLIDHIEVTNMRKSNLGAFDATLEIDVIACNMLYHQGFDIVCNSKKLPISANNIHLLWRGNEYYLRFEDKAQKAHYLIIPASHIFGLSLKNVTSTRKQTEQNLEL